MDSKKHRKYRVTATVVFTDTDGMIKNGPDEEKAFEYMFKSAFMPVKACESVNVDVEEYFEEIKDKRVAIQEAKKAELKKKRAEVEADKSKSNKTN